MTEINKTIISTNGINISGLIRDGVFLSERPIRSFFNFTSGAFTANQIKTFTATFPFAIRNILIDDININPIYTITITFQDKEPWVIIFDGSNTIKLGDIKLLNINFPLVIEKQTKISFQPNSAVKKILIMADQAINIEKIEF